MITKIRKPLAFILSLTLLLSIATFMASCSDDKTLATAEGVKIKQSRIDQLANFLAMMNGADLAQLKENEVQNVKNNMLIFCVENEIIKAAVKDKDVMTAENKQNVDDQIKQLNSYSEEITQQIKDLGITEETIRYYIESQFYSQAYYEKVTTEIDPVTDEEVAQYYESHMNDYITPATIQVSHILVSDAAISAEGKKKAEDIRKQALKKDADFAELAKQYSDDEGSAENGGDLGYITKNSGLVEPFYTAALELKTAGDISPIVETQFGYHIIKATSDLEPERQMTVEEATDAIKNVLGSEHFQKALEQLKKDSKIKYNVDVDEETGEPPTNLPDPEESQAAGDEATPAPEGGDTAEAGDDTAPADDASGGEG